MSDPEDDESTKGVGAHLTWIVLGVILFAVLLAASTILLP